MHFLIPFFCITTKIPGQMVQTFRSGLIRVCTFCHSAQTFWTHHQMGRVKRIRYLSPMRAAKVQASLRIRAVSPEPPLLAHTSSESRGTFRQKARSLAPLNDWACAVKICHDGMLEDTNSLDAAQIVKPHSSNIRITAAIILFVPKLQDFYGRLYGCLRILLSCGEFRIDISVHIHCPFSTFIVRV